MKNIALNFKKNKQFIIFSLLSIVAFTILDQFVKHYMIVKISNCYLASCKVLPFFNLTLVFNTGVSFGMFANMPYGSLIIPFFVILVICVLFYILLTTKHPVVMFAYSLVLSGAIGNTIDRFIYGGVVDFLDFYFHDWHYPAFNFADIFIFIGVFILIFYDIFKKNHKP